MSARFLGGQASYFGANDIAEVVMYDHQLTVTDRQSVESYLKSKNIP